MDSELPHIAVRLSQVFSKIDALLGPTPNAPGVKHWLVVDGIIVRDFAYVENLYTDVANLYPRDKDISEQVKVTRAENGAITVTW